MPSVLPCSAIAARPAGVDARAPVTALVIWCWKTAPRAAMPVAMPTWRKVLLAPEAMPLRWGGTTAMADDASTGLTVPMPIPATMNPGSSTVHAEPAWMTVINAHPTAISSHPGAEQAPGRARAR